MGRKKNKHKDEPQPPQTVGLTWPKERALRHRLRKKVPSEPWVEAQIVDATDCDADGNAIRYRYHDKTIFPPGQADTGMIICPVCGIYMPPNTFEHGKCLDHARHKGWGPSPSALTFRKMERMICDLESAPLEPEDLESLQQEIDNYYQKAAENGKCAALEQGQ